VSFTTVFLVESLAVDSGLTGKLFAAWEVGRFPPKLFRAKNNIVKIISPHILFIGEFIYWIDAKIRIKV
jgi:hypothetical protein